MWTPKDVAKPQKAFKPNASNKQQEQQTPQDRLCVVDKYDIPNKTVYVTEVGSDRKLEARISEKSAEYTVSSGGNRGIKFSGNSIDQDMAKTIPVGSRIVLERTLFQRKSKDAATGEERFVYSAGWISYISNPSPNKTFQGLFSVSSWGGDIQSVQNWEEKAIAIDDDDALNQLAAELDENRKSYEDKEYRPGLGIQFRVIKPVAQEDGQSEENRTYKVIDSSPPIDWVSAEKDENGEFIRAGHPLDGDRFEDLATEYCDYIYGNAEKNIPALFDEKVLEDAAVEVMVYQSYMASRLSKYMKVPDRQFDRLYILSHAETKYSFDDKDYSVGKNWAVKGILKLSDDGFNKELRVDIPRDLVTRLFANGYMGNVHSFVRTSADKKAKPDASLIKPREEYLRESAANSEHATSSSVPSQQSQVIPGPSAAAMSRVSVASAPIELEESDPFLTDEFDDLSSVETVASVVEPVQEVVESAQSVKEQTEDSGGRSRFGSSRRVAKEDKATSNAIRK